MKLRSWKLQPINKILIQAEIMDMNNIKIKSNRLLFK